MNRLLTYHAERPEQGVVGQKPSLFRESSHILPPFQAPVLGQWREDMFHETSPKPSEENNAERDEVIVIATNGIFPRFWVVIGQGEKLERVRSRFWDKRIGEKDESNEIER